MRTKFLAIFPYHFNDRYDRDSGYRTRSLLTLPMRNARGEILGVLQLINCKRNPAALLQDPADFARQVQPFRERSVRLALSLASQAAVAYENRKLTQEIEGMLDGFVNAAVTAIEQRDPTTSGHSLRVAAYTQGLAEIVDESLDGRLRRRAIQCRTTEGNPLRRPAPRFRESRRPRRRSRQSQKTLPAPA